MAALQSSQLTGPTMFPNANIGSMSNFKVAGRDIVEQHTQNVVLGNPNSSDPIQRLLFYCALDALVDSTERHDSELFLPPRCAPETRDTVLRIIIRWVKQGPSNPLFKWLTGSAGSGKSAICQTIAERFQRAGTLLANFFFSRGAASSGRSNGYRLIPTLIWQAQKNLPETRSQIKKSIANDQSLLTSTPATQMETLFCTPMNRKSLRRWLRVLVKKQIRLVVIDGLDECQGSNIQCDLLLVLADTVTRLALPLRFLIASRPEAHIVHTFHKHPSLRAAAEGRINLDEIEDAKVAVYTYVHARLREILITHPMAAHLDPSWPSQQSITFIVTKSSPQFIFASTVMNYISFPEARPDQRLNAIITMINTRSEDGSDERPLENLDALYRFIFSGVKPKYRQSVWIILGVIYLAGRQEFKVPAASPLFFEEKFGVQPGEIDIMLIPLLSVISMPKARSNPIRSLHASLFDFLLDSQRSRDLVLDLAPVHSFVLDYYSLESKICHHSDILEILQHAKELPAAIDHRLVIDCLTGAMFRFLSANTFTDKEFINALNVLQLVFDLVKIYEVNKEESGQSQGSSYEPLDSIRLPAGIPNPFTSPFSKFKYCAYVALDQAVNSRQPHLHWIWLDLPLPTFDDTEMLMHLIPASTDISAEANLVGRHHLIRGLKLLVRVGESFGLTRAVNFSWEEELPTVCRMSVIRLCERIRSTPGVSDHLLASAKEVCMVWTRLGEQREALTSERTAFA